MSNIRISGAQTTPRSESDIRINFNNTNHIIAASNAIGSSNQAQFYSNDGGATWNQTTLPLNAGDSLHSDPTVDWTSDGTAWATTIGINAAQTVLQIRAYKSTDNGATWTFDATVSGAQTDADKQQMWVDHSATSSHKDNIYVIWHNGNPVYVNRRTGPAGSWQTPLKISGAETTGTGIGGDIKTNSSGDVFAFWPDTGSKKLFVGKSTDGGVTFGAPVRIATTFDSYDIGMPSFATRRALIYISGGAYRTASKDLVYAVWTDLTGAAGCTGPANEPGTSVASTCKTRIWFSRSTDGGATWGAATMLNNQASLNDQYNPWLAVDETSGTMMVMYYDTVGDAGRKKTDVWTQTSTNDGATWGAAVKVTTAQTDETAASADSGNQYGDYNGFSGHGGKFFPSWTDRRNGAKEEIWTSGISVGGTTLKFKDDITLKVNDDITLKFNDDVTQKFKDDITLKFSDDVTLKFKDDVTLKFKDDVTLKFQDDVTVKFQDDIKLKFKDDVSFKFSDDVGPGPKGPSDVKLGGSDVGPEGPGGPGSPVQPGGLSGTPFILATPHHSMAWAGTAAAQTPSGALSFEEIIPQYEAALAALEQAMQEGSTTLQQLDAQYRQMLEEYQAVVSAYREQTGQ
jgi:hypothetical protein